MPPLTIPDDVLFYLCNAFLPNADLLHVMCACKHWMHTVEPLLFRDIDFRFSEQLLLLGHTLACDESGCRVKVAKWTLSITFAPPLFDARATPYDHRDGFSHIIENVLAEKLLQSATLLRSLALPDTGTYYNHHLLATITSVTLLPPLRHLSIAVRSEFLGCMGRIGSLIVLEELHVSVHDDVSQLHRDNPGHLLTAEIAAWNLPLLRTLFLDFRGADLRPDPFDDMIRFLLRSTLAALQVFGIRMVLDEEIIADTEIIEQLCQFLARRWSTVQVDLTPIDECGNRSWRAIISSIRAPILRLVDWFDPAVIDSLTDEVQTLELHVPIMLVNATHPRDFRTPFPLLDICVARAAAGAVGLRKIVLKLSPSEKAPRIPRQAMLWEYQRLDAYTVYGPLLVAHATRLRRTSIQCDIDEILTDWLRLQDH